ncbi:nucleotide synthetase [Novosphingobium sp. BL-8A]|uniref:nucleotide synthetase n=1 Tax=Novosphingobium sp. BL-8A TaxID=3127639 RepID=UPI00375714DD
MSTMNYTEFGLAPWIEFEVKGEDFRAEAPIQFDVRLETDQDLVVLSYNGPKDRDYISIDCNSTVQITLHGEQLWFSKQYDGITTKEPLSSFYGSIEYVDETYCPKKERYKALRFKARFNKGGQYNTCHRFNINIDFLQNPDESELKWIGLTIDPDIKNPPPQGGG